MQNKCPKCRTDLNDFSRKSIRIRDNNLLSLMLLFGKISLRSRKKASCDLCGARLRRKK